MVMVGSDERTRQLHNPFGKAGKGLLKVKGKSIIVTKEGKSKPLIKFTKG